MSEAQAITPELLATMPLPEHGGEQDKGARGKVLVVAGSRQVPGAALLAAVAALRAGAGKLQIATVESVAILMGLVVPEALCIALAETAEGDIDARLAAAILAPKLERTDAVLLGPGMLDAEETAELAEALLTATGEPRMVLDAGALTALGARREALAEAGERLIFTPHAGEMASLTGATRDAVEADPRRCAADAAKAWGATVVLKGPTTHIALPDGREWCYSEGKVGLATSGSGDTLAGVVAGLLARGCEPHVAAIWGVWLHGEAGNRLSKSHGPVGFLARELLAEVPPLMAGIGADGADRNRDGHATVPPA